MKRNRIFAFILAAAVLAGCLAGCSASGNTAGGRVESDQSGYYEGIYNRVENSSTADPEKPQETAPKVQKLIRTMDMEAETDDLDGFLAHLESRVNQLGGYIQDRSVRNGSSHSRVSYRYASLTVRIPVDQLDSFVEHIQGESNVVNYQERAEDVTLSYVATESRVTALNTEQTRLLELLAKAENMSDLLLIEERLTQVRTELEEVTSRLRLYDNLVDYGTVELSVTEVKEFTPVEEETVWQRISGGFMNSLRSLGNGISELLIFLVINLPFILFFGAIAAVIFFILMASKKKKMPKQSPQQPPTK